MVFRRRHAVTAVAAAALAVALAAAQPAVTPPRPPQGTQALGLLLRRLENVGTVLFITAHPDDENNALLVALSRGLGVRTVLFTATRGEGGQNVIGPELGDALGVLRSEELAAIHRLDGVEQRFGRAYDFGFSYSVDETMQKWGQDAILEDCVRAVRAVRPDVIATLALRAREGGLHHQAAARLAAQAFRAAADPKAFPSEATSGLEPWQASRLYEGGVGGESSNGVVAFETAQADPLLGATWFEYGGRARTLHRTQGMSAPSGARGTAARYTLVESEPADDATARKGLLDGLDLSWHRLARFAGDEDQPALQKATAAIEERLHAARLAGESGDGAATIEPLRAALGLVRRLREEALVARWSPRVKVEILSRVETKETEVMEALALAQGLEVEAVAEDADVVPGQSVSVVATVTNGGAPVKVEDVALQAPEGWSVDRSSGGSGDVETKAGLETRFTVAVPRTAEVTRPRGRKSAGFARYEMPPDERAGPIFGPPPLRARVFFRSGGLIASVDRDVEGPVSGKRRKLSVVPAVSVAFEAANVILPLHAERGRAVHVHLRYFGKGPASAVCRITTRDGWTAHPAVLPVTFAQEDTDETVQFTLTRPPGRRSSRTEVDARVALSGALYGDDVQDIDYPHIERRRVVHDARLTAQALDVRVPPGRTIGYVAGAADKVVEGLEQIGVRATRLSPEDVATGDLSRFPAIVLGIRAYQTRVDLKRNHARLFEYVQHGGHLVVQHNMYEMNHEGPESTLRPDEVSPYTPYPAAVSDARVTEETAPVTILLPKHPLLTIPNVIGPADFDGWVQERGLFFLDARDPRYEQLLAAADPFPENAGEKKGMLVSARVGAGRWTYVGLGLWRQIQAGTPGAYRILANLVGQPAVSR
jgi:LmbE family N-acetylglucosaminyl deacetylase